jgi:Uma2 family endonuclease
MGLAILKTVYLSEQDYLDAEKVSDVKHEYFDGEIFAMSGAKANHQRVTGNVFAELRQHLKGTPCEAFSSDMKVRADKGNKYFYPDVVVSCNQDGDSDFTESPRLIVEVLSPSTRRYDTHEKFALYRSILSFQDYLLIDSEKVFVQHFRKTDKNEWILHDYFDLNDSIYLGSIQETLNLNDIYDNLVFGKE